MNKPKILPSVALTRITYSAIVCVVVGAAILILGIGFDWSGFGLGVGIGLIVVGTYFLGFAGGVRRGGLRAAWLPSQDEQGGRAS